MKWVDYREKLGIGFNDQDLINAFKNRIYVMLNQYNAYPYTDYSLYAMTVGEDVIDFEYGVDFITGVKTSFQAESTFLPFLSKVVAFINTYKKGSKSKDAVIARKQLADSVLQSLTYCHIQYDLVTDDDGIFIFPKGVPEMDDALVSAPLIWLKNYPNAEKAWSKALRAYSEVNPDTASDVADLFRKALESFFQEFFGLSKSLENCKSEYGDYLKKHNVPAEIANNFVTLLDSFTKYNNNYAKHHDKSSINVLEYLMYQTGNIMRLVITLK